MLAISSPYNLWRVLASIYCLFIPPIRVLSPHPCFTPSSVFYPLIRAIRIRAIRIRIRFLSQHRISPPPPARPSSTRIRPRSLANNNQRSQRDDSRIQKERNKANDFTCKLQYDVSIFSNRRQSDLTKCPLMISQCEIMISRLV